MHPSTTFTVNVPSHGLHRRYSLRCRCGFEAKDDRSLDAHIDEMFNINKSNKEG